MKSPILAVLAAFAIGCQAVPAPTATDIPSKYPRGSYAPNLKPLVAGAGATKLFVAPDGSDQNNGLHPSNGPQMGDGPFATLEGARDAIRRLKSMGEVSREGVVVELAGGTYAQTKALMLDARDSGTPDAPIIYRAAPGQTVRLSGGKPLKQWFKVNDPVLVERLVPEARDHVRMSPLELSGVTDFGQISRRTVMHDFNKIAGLELFFDDKVMTLARFPNKGTFEKIAAMPEGEGGDVIGLNSDRMARWKGEADLWTHGYWTHDYFDSYERIASSDAEKKTITLAKPRGVGGLKLGQRLYVVNALAELDSPGEWYLDRQRGLLYFWPPRSLDGENQSGATVSIAPNIVRGDGVKFVAFLDLTMEAVRGAGVRIDNGEGNVFQNILSRNIGTDAYQIFEGKNNLICDGEITQTGEGGVFMTGGDRPSLVAAGHTVENMHIHDWSHWIRSYRSGVRMQGIGMRISHCKIHGSPHNAIAVGGNDMVTEYNEIFDVCKETGDVGVYYTGRDWAALGQIVRFNYIHDVAAPGLYGSSGIYLDDMLGGTHIYGNFFKDVTAAVFVGGGRYNTVENNLFVNCRPSVSVDNRGITWAAKGIPGMSDNLRKMPYQSALWRQRYPFLTDILEDDPQLPRHNVFVRNVSVGSKDWAAFEGAAAPHIAQIDNFVEGFQFEGDPGFVNAAAGDYLLKPDSGALKLGFKQLPFQEMGLRKKATPTK